MTTILGFVGNEQLAVNVAITLLPVHLSPPRAVTVEVIEHPLFAGTV